MGTIIGRTRQGITSVALGGTPFRGTGLQKYQSPLYLHCGTIFYLKLILLGAYQRTTSSLTLSQEEFAGIRDS